jgi:flagellar biosynthesis anti-sigma factor FlgM
MRINSFDQSQNIGTTDQVSRKQDKKTLQTPAADQDGAQISAQLQQRLVQTPEIRQDRIDAIKQARETGTYSVSDDQLSGAMFKEFFNRG